MPDPPYTGYACIDVRTCVAVALAISSTRLSSVSTKRLELVYAARDDASANGAGTVRAELGVVISSHVPCGPSPRVYVIAAYTTITSGCPLTN